MEPPRNGGSTLKRFLSFIPVNARDGTAAVAAVLITAVALAVVGRIFVPPRRCGRRRRGGRGVGNVFVVILILIITMWILANHNQRSEQCIARGKKLGRDRRRRGMASHVVSHGRKVVAVVVVALPITIMKRQTNRMVS
jgi:Na+-transporting methylmalonyl-CoA/oxaloacetate decarboxylase gamma subunit